jgi:hypothetical protein
MLQIISKTQKLFDVECFHVFYQVTIKTNSSKNERTNKQTKDLNILLLKQFIY